MGRKLSSSIKGEHRPLSERTTSPFYLCFREKLQNGYTFTDMSSANLKELQKFLDMTSQMTFQEVDKRFRRASDDNDEYRGDKVTHYEVGEKFRIHGVINKGLFFVIRLDPNHKVHR